MNILITNLYSAANRGDAAIVNGMTIALRKYFPEADFTILSKFPDVCMDITKIKTYKPLIVKLNISGYFNLFYYLLWSKLYINNIKLPTLGKWRRIKNYLDADLVLSVGGGYINDNFPVAMIRWLFDFYFSKLLGKKVIIYSNSIGPFNKTWLRPFVRYVFSKIDLITLRDPQSLESLNSIGIDISSPSIFVTADAAWSMEPLSRRAGLELLNREVPEINENILKISISARKWKFYSGDNIKSYENYTQILGKISDYIIDKYNADMFFISTCTSLGGYSNDDRKVGMDISRHMKEPGRLKIIIGEYTPQELSSIYANIDLHIGTRMHSNILAMLSGTPVLAIQYEPKTKGMMDLFELGEYIVDIETMNLQSMSIKVDKAIENRNEISKKIEEKLPELKRMSLENARLTYETYNQ